MVAFFAQQPVVFAALVTGAVAMLTLLVNARLNYSLHRQRLKADLTLFRERGAHEIELAERKANLERQAADWQRKAQFAEEVLTDFGELVARFRALRQSASEPHERERDGRDKEDLSDRTERDDFWPIL